MSGWEFNSSSNLTMLLLRSNIMLKLPLYSDIFSRFCSHPSLSSGWVLFSVQETVYMIPE